MPAPGGVTYSVDALVDAHTAFRDLIDAGTGAGKIFIRDNSDTLLAEIPLSDPCGTVDGGTGQLTFSIAGPDSSANATGTAAYCEFADSDDNVHLSMDAQVGVTPVSGVIVLNTLSIVAGAPVTVISATVG